MGASAPKLTHSPAKKATLPQLTPPRAKRPLRYSERPLSSAGTRLAAEIRSQNGRDRRVLGTSRETMDRVYDSTYGREEFHAAEGRYAAAKGFRISDCGLRNSSGFRCWWEQLRVKVSTVVIRQSAFRNPKSAIYLNCSGPMSIPMHRTSSTGKPARWACSRHASTLGASNSQKERLPSAVM